MLKISLVIFIVLAWLTLPIENSAFAADQVVSFDTSKSGKMSIKIGDHQIAVYVYQDDEMSRPYFAYLCATGALQVSRNHPPVSGQDRNDHPNFHPGLWLSFGDISGNDDWRLSAAVRQVRWVEFPQGAAGKGSFAVMNHYLKQKAFVSSCLP